MKSLTDKYGYFQDVIENTKGFFKEPLEHLEHVFNLCFMFYKDTPWDYFQDHEFRVDFRDEKDRNTMMISCYRGEKGNNVFEINEFKNTVDSSLSYVIVSDSHRGRSCLKIILEATLYNHINRSIYEAFLDLDDTNRKLVEGFLLAKEKESIPDKIMGKGAAAVHAFFGGQDTELKIGEYRYNIKYKGSIVRIFIIKNKLLDQKVDLKANEKYAYKLLSTKDEGNFDGINNLLSAIGEVIF